MPSILFINRVYPPSEGATGRVLEHVARRFSAEGWDVSVVATTDGGVPTGTTRRDGVTIIRVGVPFSRRSLLSRALGYALMIPSLFLQALSLPKHDVVVTKTDPPMLLVTGPLLRFFKGSRLIHWAQDLYPEIAEELGLLAPGGSLARLLHLISSSSMEAHDMTVAVGRCMAGRIAARGIPSRKVRVIPNAGVEREVALSPRMNSFRASHGLGEAFVIEYSGNLGRAHDFKTVLGAASMLREIGQNDILFLFIGSGAGERSLHEDVRGLDLSTVRFLPSQPSSSLSESLGAADLHLVTMRESMSGLVIPSKFYGVMAAGRPCLFIGPEESEVARVIREMSVGAVIRPGDSASLVNAILEYRMNPDLLADTGGRARDSVWTHDAPAMFLECAAGVAGL
jgi:glycosyltransferase involved in cell wall biosynthesis